MKSNALFLFFLIAAMVLGAALHSDAKVIQAASCQYADVSNAVAQASAGDVVQLPAGTNWWSQPVVLNGVSLIGAGTNSTVIIDEEANRGPIINVNPVAGTFMEIANFQFQGGVTNTSPNYNGCIAVYGVSGASWRIDHNVFNGLYGKNIVTYGNSASVIDHNSFYEKYISICCYGYIAGDNEGDISWSKAPTYGLSSSNCLYVEDNYFTNTTTWLGSVGATDGNGGGRIVFRYNTIMNDCWNDHGTESGGRVRSMRSFEVYGNTFTCPPSATSLYPIYAACMIRGGSGLIFSNTINGYSAVAAIRNYRYTCSYYNEFDPFAGANGLSPFDSNDPTLYLTGTSSSSAPSGSFYLQVNGANWTPNQWVGYTVIDTNNGNFSEINSNTANTIYYVGSTPATQSVIPCTVLAFNPGDAFQIRRVYAALDQPGRGSGDLLQDINNSWLTNGVLVTIDTATGKESWPNEALDGIYSWANNLNGADGLLESAYPGVMVGRDLYNDTPKPGYTAYTYPHPLTFDTVVTSPLGLLPPSAFRVIW